MTEEKKISAEIKISKGGPIKVTGNFTLTASNGMPIDPENPKNIALCACGRSGKKPFCDGSHNRITIEKPLI